MTKRRDFMLRVGSIAGLGVAPASARAATALRRDARDVELSGGFTKAKFDALLNQTFYIDTPDHGVVTVRLVEVMLSTNSTVRSENIEQFSLTFRGVLLPPLPSGSYEVSHLSAGKVTLYLKALPLKGSQPMYRADFSLLQ